MPTHNQARDTKKTWPRRLKRLLAVGLLIVIALAALIYLRPVATMTLVQRGLLKLSGVESKFVQVGPHRIHYLIGGNGPMLLLLHGHPSRALEWGPLLHQLTSTHRVVAIDFLGYGESDVPNVEYNITNARNHPT